MADVTISQLTVGAPASNNIIPYSTGTDTLGVPVSAMFQNTSVINTSTTGGLNGLQLYTNKLVRKSFWFIEKTLATTGPGAGPNAGDWTSLGYITPPGGEYGTGWGREIKILETHHISDSVNTVTYQLQDSYRNRLGYEGWVKVPSVSNYNYNAKQDFSLEARRTRTTGNYSNLELRFRAITPSTTASRDGGSAAFAIEILGGGEFFQTTGGGNDLTVPEGYLGNTFYQFPLRTYADDIVSFEPSTRGLFMVQPGRVGINTIAPATTLDVNGDLKVSGNITGIPAWKLFIDTTANNRTTPVGFVKSYTETFNSKGGIHIWNGGGTSGSSLMFEMTVYSDAVRTVKQFLRTVDDQANFYWNGVLQSTHNTGNPKAAINWNLTVGNNLLQIVLNDVGGSLQGIDLFGDIITTGVTFVS
jgi:hypothetical protein